MAKLKAVSEADAAIAKGLRPTVAEGPNNNLDVVYPPNDYISMVRAGFWPSYKVDAAAAAAEPSNG